ncbi:MAG: hypothetical protein CEE40_10325 [Chloroflexi bacterium B3_Chlor]|nr:MAG: hypothetical protein CEE40_10325 [Chloroflexi bacterium B3_Chlor]
MKCYVHRETDAVGVCTSCGKAVCEKCGPDIHGKRLCGQCTASARTISRGRSAARAQAYDSWVTNIPIADASERLQAFLNQHTMKVVSRQSGEVVEVIADQGSQFTARFFGGWLANPASFPKRATIRLRAAHRGVEIEAAIEETLGMGWLDPKFKRRYEDYFEEWIDALKDLLPPMDRIA